MNKMILMAHILIYDILMPMYLYMTYYLLLQSNTVYAHHRHLRFLMTEYIKPYRN